MLISKEKALNLIEHNDKVYHYADKQYEDIVYATTQKICEVVAEMPAADVQPVRHGRWEYIRNVKLSGTIKLCECNQCHNKIFGGLSYCGNCGARMDGDTNG